jgi:uncharacterized membrane protein
MVRGTSVDIPPGIVQAVLDAELMADVPAAEVARATTTVTAAEQPWMSQRYQMRKEIREVDQELLAYLQRKAMAQPREASLLPALVQHGERWLADTPSTKALSEVRKTEMLARAVYGAMVVLPGEIAGRQFIKSARNLEQAQKHAKMVTTGELGPRGFWGSITRKSVRLPQPKP